MRRRKGSAITSISAIFPQVIVKLSTLNSRPRGAQTSRPRHFARSCARGLRLSSSQLRVPAGHHSQGRTGTLDFSLAQVRYDGEHSSQGGNCTKRGRAILALHNHLVTREFDPRSLLAIGPHFQSSPSQG